MYISQYFGCEVRRIINRNKFYFMRCKFWSISALFVVLSVVAFVGCSKEETAIVRTLQLSTHGVSFDAEGGSREITVTPHPEGEPWQVRGEAAWFDYAVEGNTLTITADKNDDTESRTAYLEIVSPEGHFKAFVLTISQEAAVDAALCVGSAESYVFDSMGGNYTFVVEANYEWTITSSDEWITVVKDGHHATISAGENAGAERHGEVVIAAGGEQYVIAISQDTHANNAYLKLLGRWEITASKWFYSPNGSLNSLDYAPNPPDYYLIFDIDEAEYGKSLVMRDFLYPGTELEVRYDAQTGGIIIPFGWTVLSYDVFFYVTLVNSTQFSYASLEVEALPNDDVTTLTFDMPTVDGFNYVGFGLWTYNDSGAKVALGSNYRPTMFPMGDIQLVKHDK